MNANIQLSYPASIADRLVAFFTKSKAKEKNLSAIGFQDICYHLMVKAMLTSTDSTAQVFESIMERSDAIKPEHWAFLNAEPEGKKVLVDNEYLKVVLISWAPGSHIPIHGHPAGSGLIKVLQGSVEELRYKGQEAPTLYAKHTYERNDVGYIDDGLGQHAVGNPFNSTAVTLHAYLKYR